MINLKYEYLLETWGGFYEDVYSQIHNQEEGYHYFDTKQQREEYIKELRDIEKSLGVNACLVTLLSEGYHCRTTTILHRVTKHKGKEYYTTNKLNPNCSYGLAVYLLEHKWRPGCNDYPLGEDFNYNDRDSYEVIEEWVTGAFTKCK